MSSQDSYDIADSEGPSDFDVRHRFVVNAIYELPFKGNRVRRTAGRSASITQAQTGNPINIVTNINTFTGVNNTLRPDLVGDPAIIGSPTQWFSNSVLRSAHRRARARSSVGVRAAGVAERRVPFRQPRAQRDHTAPASATPTSQ